MFDTHCHLNFSRFKKNVDEVIISAQEKGIKLIVIPGTDLETSEKAISIAQTYIGLYAAVGIHPHHTFEMNQIADINQELKNIELLLDKEKVVAIGEVGLDKHIYTETKYVDYQIDDTFMNIQQDILIKQINLALTYNKSLILHNREAADDLLSLLHNHWDKKLEGKTVFHCCEPNTKLLEFAKQHSVYIGVDGDITYNQTKQEFIHQIPLNLLVLETDSPFLLPEPLRSQKLYPNTPANIPLIATFISSLLKKDVSEIVNRTTQNASHLFRLA